MFWNDSIDPAIEPAKVLLKRGEFVDENRPDENGNARVVPFKIYHPADHDFDRLPLIVWSHGFGGNRDVASFLSRYLASHGYVVAHITHHGTDSSLWEGKDGHPWDILRQAKVSRETTLNRFYDVPFALDQIKIWTLETPEIGDLLDFENIGMSGHSFGALTTQVMAGMMIPNQDGDLIRLREERFKAGILYSPVPIAHLSDAPPEDLYGPIDIPLLHMTGTQDTSPLEGFDYDYRLVVYEYTRHPEKYLLVKQEGDHMVYNGTRGKLEVNPNRERHEEIIKIGALAFWAAHLKNDEKAREWLSEGGYADYIGADGKFEAQG